MERNETQPPAPQKRVDPLVAAHLEHVRRKERVEMEKARVLARAILAELDGLDVSVAKRKPKG